MFVAELNHGAALRFPLDLAVPQVQLHVQGCVGGCQYAGSGKRRGVIEGETAG
jgi:hypothetical protein